MEEDFSWNGIVPILTYLIVIYILNLFKEDMWDALTVSVTFSDVHNGDFEHIKTWLGSKLDHPPCPAEKSKTLVYDNEKSEIKTDDKKSETKTDDEKSEIKNKKDQKVFRLANHVWGKFSNKATSYGQKLPKLRGGPLFGSTFFFYAGKVFRVTVTLNPDVRLHTSSTATLKISAFKWNSEALESLLLEALTSGAGGGKENQTTVFGICDTFHKWRPLGSPKPRRSTESVFLAKGQVEHLVKDIQSFQNARKWYEDRSIPHRRGYLLYGPPGCGKTSMVRAIAGEFKQDICSLSLSAKGLTDDVLIHHLNKTPANTLILVEDIDCAFKARGDIDASTAETNLVLAGSSGSAVTFRGLLNALDGVASCDGKIVFLTTNHPEKLDPALTRPGRVDIKVLLDYPDEEQILRFFCRFYPDTTESVKRQFLTEIKSIEQKVSLAMVQGLFMMYKENAEDAIAGCRTYFEEQFKIMPKYNDINANLFVGMYI